MFKYCTYEVSGSFSIFTGLHKRDFKTFYTCIIRILFAHGISLIEQTIKKLKMLFERIWDKERILAQKLFEN